MTEGVSTLSILLLAFLLVLSAFFSSSEIVFISQQRVRLQHRVGQGSAAARHVEELLQHPGRQLSTILLGDNLVKVAAVAISTAFAVSLLDPERGLLLATLGVTAVILIFAEILPKAVATDYSDPLALVYVYPIRFLAFILGPVVRGLGWLAKGIAALVGERRQRLAGEEEIRSMATIGLAEGSVQPEEAEMVERVFHFGDRLAREIMTPRPEIVWVEEGTTFAEFLPFYLSATHTRFPVYLDTFDNVVGVLFVKDVLQARAQGTATEISSITDQIRRALFVPETKRIGSLFTEMRSARRQMALIVDEYRSIAGLLTYKRLVTETVGDVGDEFAVPEPVTPIDQDSFHVEASMSIDDANERLALNFPRGDYQTVAGFLLSILGYVTQDGEQVSYNGPRLIVERMLGAKINQVLIRRRD